MAYDRPPNCPDLRMGGVYAGVPETGHPWVGVGVGHRILGMEVSIVGRSEVRGLHRNRKTYRQFL